MALIPIQFMELSRREVPSDVVLLYYFFNLVGSWMKVFNLVTRKGLTDDKFYTQMYMVGASLTTIVFIIECIGSMLEKRSVKDDPNASILDGANLFSRLSLYWFNSFIIQASEATLTLNNLPHIANDYTAEYTNKQFVHNWNKRKSNSTIALVHTLWTTFGSLIVISSMWESLFDAITFVEPFLLRQLILFAKSYWGEGTPVPITIGIYCALGIFLVAVIKSILGTLLFHYLVKAIANASGALYTQIYNKSLVLSINSRQNQTVGQMVNLMSIDVMTIINVVWQVTTIWEAPLQFTMCFFSLYQLIGNSVWFAVAILLMFIPVNIFVLRQVKKLRRQQMVYKDERTRLTTEIVTNVKSLKLYGWEAALLQRLDHVRNSLELRNLKSIILVSRVTEFLWVIIPYLMSSAAFLGYSYASGQALTSEIIFPALTLFNMMTAPLNDIPRVITTLVDSWVSFTRLANFFLADEMQHDAITHSAPATKFGEVSVSLENATLSWDEKDDKNFPLNNLNFKATKGELTCLVGKVGSGKTTFLRSLLGELFLREGSIEIKGNIAYFSQDPWLVSASIKNNILFGNRYDPEFYLKTIKACALESDLEILPDGDETEIGERGVSLSGGQKARVSLARAVYARADIYLLDDPLSAVDEHVGSHIIKNVLSSEGLLASKTRVLTTNAITVLSKANNITLLKDRTIHENGSMSEVMAAKGELFELLQEFGREASEEDHSAYESGSDSSVESESEILIDTDTSDTAVGSRPISRKTSSETLRRASVASYTVKRMVRKSMNLRTARTEEISQKGRVKWDVYKRYATACGYFPLFSAFILIVAASLQTLFATNWLKTWSDRNSVSGNNGNLGYYLGGYIIIGLVGALLSVSSKLMGRQYGGLAASKVLHDYMAKQVLRSPMSFFETTPLGRIINRFSGDMAEVDDGLPMALLDFFRTVVRLVMSLGVVVVTAPFIILILLPLSFLYNYYQKHYKSASRELKRLLSVARSPIFSHFQESLNGVSTIRAFDQIQRFKYIHTVNAYNLTKAQFFFRNCNRWLSFRLQTIGGIIVFSAALSIVFGSSSKAMSPGLIGLVMVYAVQVTDALSWIVRILVALENSVVGAERILEYCDLESEKDEIVESNRPPAYWPTEGKVTYNNYSTKYREGLDLILKNVNLDIKPREKIGVVGRTGAGKSSLIMSLFRIIEPVEGNIVVDDIDITKIGLHDLRSNLAIIPQDSQIFEGTLRQNLDPFDEYSDDELWRVLELSHLKVHVETMEGKLETKINEGGSNLSAGQRQLMCLGRALLHRSNVLVLDEATSSVDVQTDKWIQDTIRTECKNKTIITIAHRLNTIIDSDRIIVLEKGSIAEFDSPAKLLENEDSLFYSLCKQGGLIKSSESSGGSTLDQNESSDNEENIS